MGMLMTAYSKFDTFVPCDDSADLQLDKVALALVIQRRGTLVNYFDIRTSFLV